MKRIVWFMFFLLFIAGMPLVGMAADVNININVPPPPPPPAQEEAALAEAPPEAPPPLEFAAPPDVVVVPSGAASVYLVPNMVGVYFYGGYWYRFHRGYWFRASVYNGPWGFVAATVVPQPVVVIPPDYILGIPSGYHRIHYHEFYNHWRGWDRDRHWHNQPWYREHSLHHWGGREFVRPVHYGDRGPHDKGGKIGGDRKTIGSDRRPRTGGPGGGGPAGAGPKVGAGGHGPGGSTGTKVGAGAHGPGGPGGTGAGPGAGAHGSGKPSEPGAKP